MKKLFGPFIMLAVLASGFMSSCGPSAEELEKEAQRIADSLRNIAIADSLRQDSIQKAEQAAAEAAAAAAAAAEQENGTEDDGSEGTDTDEGGRPGASSTDNGDGGRPGATSTDTDNKNESTGGGRPGATKK